jgi:uncharacterized protein YciI
MSVLWQDLKYGARMLRKKLYVVLSRGGAAPEKIAEYLPRHLEYMIGLEKKGVLFASGPLTAAAGTPAGDGLTILRAANAERWPEQLESVKDCGVPPKTRAMLPHLEPTF